MSVQEGSQFGKSYIRERYNSLHRRVRIAEHRSVSRTRAFPRVTAPLLLVRTFSVLQNCVTSTSEQLGLPYSFKPCKTPRCLSCGSLNNLQSSTLSPAYNIMHLTEGSLQLSVHCPVPSTSTATPTIPAQHSNHTASSANLSRNATSWFWP